MEKLFCGMFRVFFYFTRIKRNERLLGSELFYLSKAGLLGGRQYS